MKQLNVKKSTNLADNAFQAIVRDQNCCWPFIIKCRKSNVPSVDWKKIHCCHILTHTLINLTLCCIAHGPHNRNDCWCTHQNYSLNVAIRYALLALMPIISWFVYLYNINQLNKYKNGTKKKLNKKLFHLQINDGVAFFFSKFISFVFWKRVAPF